MGLSEILAQFGPAGFAVYIMWKMFLYFKKKLDEKDNMLGKKEDRMHVDHEKTIAILTGVIQKNTEALVQMELVVSENTKIIKELRELLHTQGRV